MIVMNEPLASCPPHGLASASTVKMLSPTDRVCRIGPNRKDADECELDSRHDQLINVLFADGHVQPVSDDVDQFVYRKMARRNP